MVLRLVIGVGISPWIAGPEDMAETLMDVVKDMYQNPEKTSGIIEDPEGTVVGHWKYSDDESVDAAVVVSLGA